MHQLSTIFNSASTAIIVFTPQQEIIFSNTAALRLFGYANLTGTHVPDLFYPTDQLDIQAFLQDLEHKKQISKSIHATGGHKSGGKLPLRITLKRISGLSSYYVALIETRTYVVPEIAQQHPLPFLYQEIQTSLDTLTSATQSLLNTTPNHEQSVYLKLIESSGNHLRRTFDAFTHNRKEITFEFRKIIEVIKNFYKNQVKAQSISLRFLIEEDIPRMLTGDPQYLKQALHYLLSHLCTSATHGSIFIQIYLHQEIQSAHVLLFKITCTNMGLTYFQANDIVNMLNEISQNIKIQPVSQAVLDYRSGHNTIIDLFLPFTTSGMEEPMAVDNKPSILVKRPLLEGLKILYVDDVTSNQLLMEGLCHHWGVKLDSAFSGAEALEKIRQTQYDVVLMDLYMPDMNGFETVDHIRKLSHPKQAQTPILAVSASVSEDAQSRANGIGMDDFIAKPINPDLLFQKLAQFLK